MANLAFEQGYLDRAEEYDREALTIRTKLAPNTAEYAECLTTLASIHRHKGDTAGATQMYEQALDALEHQTAHLGSTDEIRSNFRASHESYYSDYIDLLLEQHKTEQAFEVFERSRARTLLETMAAARVDV